MEQTLAFKNDSDTDTPQIMNVKVLNRNDFPIVDRFDGIIYTFLPNKALSIPVDAANHIFGWHDQVARSDLNRHVQKRMGWNTPDMVKTSQHERFANAIDITPIIYRMVPVEVDPDAPPKPRPNIAWHRFRTLQRGE